MNRIELYQGDITDQHVDVIVNAANSSLLGGGGVDGAIHRRGGPEILEACRRLRAEALPDGLPVGDAVATIAGNLNAKHVVHTVGPIWTAGSTDANRLLASAYRRSLETAQGLNARTIAFPAISAGAYRFPLDEAARIALESVAEYSSDHPDSFDEIRFVLFSEGIYKVFEQELKRLERESAASP